MDCNQNKLLDLLQEIHDTCEKLNILYVLGGITAEEADIHGCLPPEKYTAVVYMTLKDFICFRDYVNSNMSDNRVIEGLDNNKRFPGFFFRYVDKNTTYYNYNDGNTYIHNGIHVRIEILKRYFSPKKTKKLVSRERGFAFNSYRYRRKISFKSNILKLWTGFKLIFARDIMAKRLYNDCVKKYMENKDFVLNYGVYNRKRTKLVKYPSYLLTGRRLVDFEGHKLYVPMDLSVHTGAVLGRMPSDAPLEPVNNSTVVISDITPYGEYITDLRSRQQTARLRRKIRFADKMHGAVTYHIRKDWKIMQAVNARLDMINAYMPRKEEILSLYSKGDFEGLTTILEEYDIVTREHLSKAGMTIYFDKDIFDVYLAWLSHNSQGKLVRKMNKSIPKEWKKSRV